VPGLQGSADRQTPLPRCCSAAQHRAGVPQALTWHGLCERSCRPVWQGL